ncbi:type IV secretory system conjugative DNA transfer family protein [Nocardia sp. CA-128927]|uniref:type IV secretory system conjugative DNA transfer family protein n=1 Tax=Nocardia sp. CA-128927 TaxID=3239975 RepID=UPI003D9983D2
MNTVAALPIPAHRAWLPDFLRDPGTGNPVPDLGEHLRHLFSPGGVIVAAAVAAVLATLVVLARRRRRRLAAGAREVTVLAPPKVDPAGAAGLWAHLIGVTRPAWKRALFGQPHLGFEYRITPETGVTITIWVPATIPPGLVERAVESAWPGARTRTAEHANSPLPGPTPGHRQVLIGGEQRLARREGLPIRLDYSGNDPIRDLIAAASNLEAGQAACVQILARPATGRRVRRIRAGIGRRWYVAVFADLLDLITPGRAHASRYQGARLPTSPDRQTAMEYTTQARAAATKARGAHWATVIRYAVSTEVPLDAQGTVIGGARAVTRGRAHTIGAVFAACTDHNYYRRHRRWRLETALRGRYLGRGDLLSVPELAGIAHVPTDSDIPGVARAGARAVAPSPTIAIGGAYAKPLGVSDTGTGRAVAVRVTDARHHLHVLGATGVGKSTLLGRMILDDAEAGRSVVVVDPKGDLITDILDRLPHRHAERVVLFDADSRSRPPCLNPLDADRADVDRTTDNLVTIFRRIYAQYWGPRTDDVLRASLLTLCNQGGVATLADLPRLLIEPGFRARITKTVTDPVLQGFWSSYEALSDAGRTQVIGPLLNKLRAFLLRPFVKASIAAGPSTVDLGKVLDHGGICLARLPKGSLGEETTRLVGSLIVARTWQATAARARTPATSRRDASLVLDEAHNFLNLSSPIEDMLAEARGLRLSLVLAHQNLGQLPRELRDGISANARNKITFTASPEDARELARHTAPFLSEHDLTHLDAYHAAARLLVNGQQAPPFTLTTTPLPPPVPGRAREIRAIARAHNTTQPTPATAAPTTRQTSTDARRR